MSSVEPSARRALAIAAALLFIEAAAYVAVLVVPAGPSIEGSGSGRLGAGIVLFVSGYAVFHLVIAFGLVRRWTHVRGAVIATQAIQLGLAWNLRGIDAVWIPSALGATALAVFVLVLLPSVTRAIHGDDAGDEGV